jgi:hypothetical protein
MIPGRSLIQHIRPCAPTERIKQIVDDYDQRKYHAAGSKGYLLLELFMPGQVQNSAVIIERVNSSKFGPRSVR